MELLLSYFKSCGHCWVFQICWHVECSTLTASSFRVWSSSVGILSPSLALFIMMLPKSHLTLHSKYLALGEWSHHHDYLGHYSSSVYSCHLFLISSASFVSIPFLSIIVPIFVWNVPLLSNFLEELSSLCQSVVFLCFFALITKEGFLIYPCYSSELSIHMGISFLFSFAFSFSSFLSYF